MLEPFIEEGRYALPGLLRVALVATPDTTLGEGLGAVIVPVNPSEPPLSSGFAPACSQRAWLRSRSRNRFAPSMTCP